MSQDRTEGLVRMANQIALNLEPGPGGDAEAAERVASHLRRFWSRGMKELIIARAEENATELRPVARKGIELLSQTYPG